MNKRWRQRWYRFLDWLDRWMWEVSYTFAREQCPAPCPSTCRGCTRDRQCECYEHQHLCAEDE